MKIKGIYLVSCLIVMTVELGASRIAKAPVSNVSYNVMLLKMLEYIDSTSNDESLIKVALNLITGMCLCMQEIYNDSSNKMNSTNNETKTMKNLYSKIYNQTCWLLKNQLSSRRSLSSDRSNDDKSHNSTINSIINSKQTKPEDSKLRNILQLLFNTTRGKHVFTIQNRNIFEKLITFKKPNHSVIVIITIHSSIHKDKEVFNDTEVVTDNEIENIINSLSSVDIDIIDGKYGPRDNRSRPQPIINPVFDCHLRSVYTFLVSSENHKSIKIFKILRRKGKIKLYIDVLTNNDHKDFSSMCCFQSDGLCEINFNDTVNIVHDESKQELKTDHFGSYRDTISNIKNLLELYVKESDQNIINSNPDCIKPLNNQVEMVTGKYLYKNTTNATGSSKYSKINNNSKFPYSNAIKGNENKDTRISNYAKYKVHKPTKIFFDNVTMTPDFEKRHYILYSMASSSILSDRHNDTDITLILSHNNTKNLNGININTPVNPNEAKSVNKITKFKENVHNVLSNLKKLNFKDRKNVQNNEIPDTNRFEPFIPKMGQKYIKTKSYEDVDNFHISEVTENVLNTSIMYSNLTDQQDYKYMINPENKLQWALEPSETPIKLKNVDIVTKIAPNEDLNSRGNINIIRIEARNQILGETHPKLSITLNENYRLNVTESHILENVLNSTIASDNHSDLITDTAIIKLTKNLNLSEKHWEFTTDKSSKTTLMIPDQTLRKSKDRIEIVNISKSNFGGSNVFTKNPHKNNQEVFTATRKYQKNQISYDSIDTRNLASKTLQLQTEIMKLEPKPTFTTNKISSDRSRSKNTPKMLNKTQRDMYFVTTATDFNSYLYVTPTTSASVNNKGSIITESLKNQINQYAGFKIKDQEIFTVPASTHKQRPVITENSSLPNQFALITTESVFSSDISKTLIPNKSPIKLNQYDDVEHDMMNFKMIKSQLESNELIASDDNIDYGNMVMTKIKENSGRVTKNLNNILNVSHSNQVYLPDTKNKKKYFRPAKSSISLDSDMEPFSQLDNTDLDEFVKFSITDSNSKTTEDPRKSVQNTKPSSFDFVNFEFGQNMDIKTMQSNNSNHQAVRRILKDHSSPIDINTLIQIKNKSLDQNARNKISHSLLNYLKNNTKLSKTLTTKVHIKDVEGINNSFMHKKIHEKLLDNASHVTQMVVKLSLNSSTDLMTDNKPQKTLQPPPQKEDVTFKYLLQDEQTSLNNAVKGRSGINALDNVTPKMEGISVDKLDFVFRTEKPLSTRAKNGNYAKNSTENLQTSKENYVKYGISATGPYTKIKIGDDNKIVEQFSKILIIRKPEEIKNINISLKYPVQIPSKIGPTLSTDYFTKEMYRLRNNTIFKQEQNINNNQLLSTPVMILNSQILPEIKQIDTNTAMEHTIFGDKKTSQNHNKIKLLNTNLKTIVNYDRQIKQQRENLKETDFLIENTYRSTDLSDMTTQSSDTSRYTFTTASQDVTKYLHVLNTTYTNFVSNITSTNNEFQNAQNLLEDPTQSSLQEHTKLRALEKVVSDESNMTNGNKYENVKENRFNYSFRKKNSVNRPQATEKYNQIDKPDMFLDRTTSKVEINSNTILYNYLLENVYFSSTESCSEIYTKSLNNSVIEGNKETLDKNITKETTDALPKENNKLLTKTLVEVKKSNSKKETSIFNLTNKEALENATKMKLAQPDPTETVSVLMSQNQNISKNIGKDNILNLLFSSQVIDSVKVNLSQTKSDHNTVKEMGPVMYRDLNSKEHQDRTAKNFDLDMTQNMETIPLENTTTGSKEDKNRTVPKIYLTMIKVTEPTHLKNTLLKSKGYQYLTAAKIDLIKSQERKPIPPEKTNLNSKKDYFKTARKKDLTLTQVTQSLPHKTTVPNSKEYQYDKINVITTQVTKPIPIENIVLNFKQYKNKTSGKIDLLTTEVPEPMRFENISLDSKERRNGTATEIDFGTTQITDPAHLEIIIPNLRTATKIYFIKLNATEPISFNNEIPDSEKEVQFGTINKEKMLTTTVTEIKHENGLLKSREVQNSTTATIDLIMKTAREDRYKTADKIDLFTTEITESIHLKNAIPKPRDGQYGTTANIYLIKATATEPIRFNNTITDSEEDQYRTSSKIDLLTTQITKPTRIESISLKSRRDQHSANAKIGVIKIKAPEPTSVYNIFLDSKEDKHRTADKSGLLTTQVSEPIRIKNVILKSREDQYDTATTIDLIMGTTTDPMSFNNTVPDSDEDEYQTADKADLLTTQVTKPIRLENNIQNLKNYLNITAAKTDLISTKATESIDFNYTIPDFIEDQYRTSNEIHLLTTKVTKSKRLDNTIPLSRKNEHGMAETINLIMRTATDPISFTNTVPESEDNQHQTSTDFLTTQVTEPINLENAIPNSNRKLNKTAIKMDLILTKATESTAFNNTIPYSKKYQYRTSDKPDLLTAQVTESILIETAIPKSKDNQYNTDVKIDLKMTKATEPISFNNTIPDSKEHSYRTADKIDLLITQVTEPIRIKTAILKSREDQYRTDAKIDLNTTKATEPICFNNTILNSKEGSCRTGEKINLSITQVTEPIRIKTAILKSREDQYSTDAEIDLNITKTTEPKSFNNTIPNSKEHSYRTADKTDLLITQFTERIRIKTDILKSSEDQHSIDAKIDLNMTKASEPIHFNNTIPRSKGVQYRTADKIDLLTTELSEPTQLEKSILNSREDYIAAAKMGFIEKKSTGPVSFNNAIPYSKDDQYRTTDRIDMLMTQVTEPIRLDNATLKSMKHQYSTAAKIDSIMTKVTESSRFNNMILVSKKDQYKTADKIDFLTTQVAESILLEKTIPNSRKDQYSVFDKIDSIAIWGTEPISREIKQTNLKENHNRTVGEIDLLTTKASKTTRFENVILDSKEGQNETAMKEDFITQQVSDLTRIENRKTNLKNGQNRTVDKIDLLTTELPKLEKEQYVTGTENGKVTNPVRLENIISSLKEDQYITAAKIKLITTQESQPTLFSNIIPESKEHQYLVETSTEKNLMTMQITVPTRHENRTVNSNGDLKIFSLNIGEDVKLYHYAIKKNGTVADFVSTRATEPIDTENSIMEKKDLLKIFLSNNLNNIITNSQSKDIISKKESESGLLKNTIQQIDKNIQTFLPHSELIQNINSDFTNDTKSTNQITTPYPSPMMSKEVEKVSENHSVNKDESSSEKTGPGSEKPYANHSTSLLTEGYDIVSSKYNYNNQQSVYERNRILVNKTIRKGNIDKVPKLINFSQNLDAITPIMWMKLHDNVSRGSIKPSLKAPKSSGVPVILKTNAQKITVSPSDHNIIKTSLEIIKDINIKNKSTEFASNTSKNNLVTGPKANTKSTKSILEETQMQLNIYNNRSSQNKKQMKNIAITTVNENPISIETDIELNSNTIVNTNMTENQILRPFQKSSSVTNMLDDPDNVTQYQLDKKNTNEHFLVYNTNETVINSTKHYNEFYTTTKTTSFQKTLILLSDVINPSTETTTFKNKFKSLIESFTDKLKLNDLNSIKNNTAHKNTSKIYVDPNIVSKLIGTSTKRLNKSNVSSIDEKLISKIVSVTNYYKRDHNFDKKIPISNSQYVTIEQSNVNEQNSETATAFKSQKEYLPNFTDTNLFQPKSKAQTVFVDKSPIIIVKPSDLMTVKNIAKTSWKLPLHIGLISSKPPFSLDVLQNNEEDILINPDTENYDTKLIISPKHTIYSRNKNSLTDEKPTSTFTSDPLMEISIQGAQRRELKATDIEPKKEYNVKNILNNFHPWTTESPNLPLSSKYQNMLQNSTVPPLNIFIPNSKTNHITTQFEDHHIKYNFSKLTTLINKHLNDLPNIPRSKLDESTFSIDNLIYPKHLDSAFLDVSTKASIHTLLKDLDDTNSYLYKSNYSKDIINKSPIDNKQENMDLTTRENTLVPVDYEALQYSKTSISSEKGVETIFDLKEVSITTPMNVLSNKYISQDQKAFNISNINESSKYRNSNTVPMENNSLNLPHKYLTTTNSTFTSETIQPSKVLAKYIERPIDGNYNLVVNKQNATDDSSNKNKFDGLPDLLINTTAIYNKTKNILTLSGFESNNKTPDHQAINLFTQSTVLQDNFKKPFDTNKLNIPSNEISTTGFYNHEWSRNTNKKEVSFDKINMSTTASELETIKIPIRPNFNYIKNSTNFEVGKNKEILSGQQLENLMITDVSKNNKEGHETISNHIVNNNSFTVATESKPILNIASPTFSTLYIPTNTFSKSTLEITSTDNNTLVTQNSGIMPNTGGSNFHYNTTKQYNDDGIPSEATYRVQSTVSIIDQSNDNITINHDKSALINLNYSLKESDEMSFNTNKKEKRIPITDWQSIFNKTKFTKNSKPVLEASNKNAFLNSYPSKNDNHTFKLLNQTLFFSNNTNISNMKFSPLYIGTTLNPDIYLTVTNVKYKNANFNISDIIKKPTQKIEFNDNLEPTNASNILKNITKSNNLNNHNNTEHNGNDFATNSNFNTLLGFFKGYTHAPTNNDKFYESKASYISKSNGKIDNMSVYNNTVSNDYNNDTTKFDLNALTGFDKKSITRNKVTESLYHLRPFQQEMSDVNSLQHTYDIKSSYSNNVLTRTVVSKLSTKTLSHNTQTVTIPTNSFKDKLPAQLYEFSSKKDQTYMVNTLEPPISYQMENNLKTQTHRTGSSSHLAQVTSWWMDDMYLKVRMPLPINFNPGMVFPKRHFAKIDEVADLGALFIDDLLDYKEMLDRGELPLERATSREKGQPLCMEQFYRLLGVCRIPEVGKDRLELPVIKHDGAESEELVVVACRNYFYPIPVKAVDRGRLTPGEIQAQLLHCLVDAAGAPAAPRVGLLTAMNRDRWARARETLIRDENNRANLELISRALCILCLDEAGGDRADADADTNAFLRAMHGGGTNYHSANRWFDKTVQLIISSDGTLGMCYEHSPAEGVAVVRLAERALARAAVAARPAPPPVLLPAPQRMRWSLTPELLQTIDQAGLDLDRSISDLDFKVYTYRGYGREFMKACRTSPDVFIQLALQYAYYKMYGCLVSTYESASLRRFRAGRVDNIRSAHAQALAWAAAMCAADASPLPGTDADDSAKKVSFNLYGERKKLELFEEASRKQTSVMEANILGLGMDNHLLALREAAREALGDLPALFTDDTYKKMIDFKLSTSQVATTTDGTFMGYAAVVPDGYGCSYNPKKDHVIFCIGSFLSSSVTNTDAFAQSLEEALDSMKLMFQNRVKEN